MTVPVDLPDVDYVDNAIADTKSKIFLEAIFSTGNTLAVLAGSLAYRVPVACTLVGVSVAAGSIQPTGSALIVDIDKNGTTIFGTQANRPSLAPGAASSFTDKTKASITSFQAGDLITIDIDQVGSSISGTGLTVQVELNPV